jgi:hypothetical protein
MSWFLRAQKIFASDERSCIWSEKAKSLGPWAPLCFHFVTPSGVVALPKGFLLILKAKIVKHIFFMKILEQSYDFATDFTQPDRGVSGLCRALPPRPLAR